MGEGEEETGYWQTDGSRAMRAEKDRNKSRNGEKESRWKHVRNKREKKRERTGMASSPFTPPTPDSGR